MVRPILCMQFFCALRRKTAYQTKERTALPKAKELAKAKFIAIRVRPVTKGDGSMLVQERKTARPMRFSMRQRRMLAGYLFISPVVLGYLIWVAGPMAIAVWLSLTDWDLLRTPRFIGLENYRTMVQTDLFWKSLGVTFYFTLVSVPLSLVLSFAVAMLMNVKVRGIAFFRVLFYMPSIVPAVANAVLWVWVL